MSVAQSVEILSAADRYRRACAHHRECDEAYHLLYEAIEAAGQAAREAMDAKHAALETLMAVSRGDEIPVAILVTTDITTDSTTDITTDEAIVFASDEVEAEPVEPLVHGDTAYLSLDEAAAMAAFVQETMVIPGQESFPFHGGADPRGPLPDAHPLIVSEVPAYELEQWADDSAQRLRTVPDLHLYAASGHNSITFTTDPNLVAVWKQGNDTTGERQIPSTSGEAKPVLWEGA